jgi:hypothetical protein
MIHIHALVLRLDMHRHLEFSQFQEYLTIIYPQ